VDLDLTPSTCASYTALGEAWERLGGIWGGRWKDFGPCGDAGHYAWAPTGAVPLAICPEALSLPQCEALRHAYLANAGPRGSLAAVTLLGVAGAALWWVLR
jgi:hypothetical protein